MDLAGLDAETAADRLGELIDATAAEFTRWGTVEASRGDTVTAVFGAPLAHEDHAERAVHAALAIRHRVIKVVHAPSIHCSRGRGVRRGSTASW
jgi:class 3 adenylate cyclase